MTHIASRLYRPLRKKLGASSKTSFSDLVTLFAGLNVKRANGYMKEPWELLPIAAENHYTGKRDKLHGNSRGGQSL